MASAVSLAPPSARLLIGVISYSPGGKSLQRRQAIRALSETDPRTAVVRFVMANETRGDDAKLGDVVFLPVPTIDTLHTRKIFLRVRWFAHVVRTPALRNAFDFVAQADDDSLYNAAGLAEVLAPFVSVRYVVYGPFQAWYMWSPTAMRAHCYGRKPFRFLLGLRAWRQLTGDNRSFTGVVPEEAHLNECYSAGDYGPFPLISGPFTAYSMPLIEGLHALPELQPELFERFMLSPARMGYIDPILSVNKTAFKVANYMFIEDAYYCYLKFRYFGDEPLTLVSQPFSDWRFQHPVHVFPAHLYHRIKEPKFYAYFQNRSNLLRRPRPSRGVKCDNTFGNKLYRLGRHGQNWTLCAWHKRDGEWSAA